MKYKPDKLNALALSKLKETLVTLDKLENSCKRCGIPYDIDVFMKDRERLNQAIKSKQL